MTGVAGVFGLLEKQEARSAVEGMLEVLLHTEHDRAGTLEQPSMGVVAGWWCRNQDSSVPGPIYNRGRTKAIILVGDHFPEVRAVLGGDARNESVVAILELLEECGDDVSSFLRRLNGWFSGLLIDRMSGEAVLFNDRYGLRRIYCHRRGEQLYFASEAKALLKRFPDVRRFDPQSLGEYYACGCALQDRSLYNGIFCLPPGSRWSFTAGGGLKVERYFRVSEWEGLPKLSRRDFDEAIQALFAQLMPKYLAGEDPIGVSLTGGVDSRLLMASLGAQARVLPCYTFGGSIRESADVKLAREIAKVCGQPHSVIKVGKEFLDGFAEFARDTILYSDGVMDLTGAPDLYANRIARSIAPIRLTGNYGGEILRSIVAFKPVDLDRSVLSGDLCQYLDAAQETYRTELGNKGLAFIAFKQVPWHHHCRFSVEQRVLNVRSPYLDNALVRLMFQAPSEVSNSNELSLSLIRRGNGALGGFATDRGLSATRIPVYSRMCNLTQEFLFKAEYAYDYGMPNWLARTDAALKAAGLERLFLGRHKFYHFRLWYRRELASYVKEILLDPITLARPFFDRRGIERIVWEHTSGRGNFTLELHRILSLELIARYLLN